MIKRLVWTIIILLPTVIISFLSILGWTGSENTLAGAALVSTWNAINTFIDLFGDEANFWAFLENLILASLFIAPLIFVWRGIFFIGWIPLIGDAIRAIVMAAIVLTPWLMQLLADGSGDYDKFINYFQTAVTAIALIGLWLPNFITSKKKK